MASVHGSLVVLMLRWAGVLIVLLLWVGEVRAQPSAQGVTPSSTGLELAAKAAQAYAAGDFAKAIVLYQESYDMSPDPGAHHNIAKCHEAIAIRVRASPSGRTAADTAKVAATELELAIASYQRYLDEEGSAANGPLIRQKLLALKAEVELLRKEKEPNTDSRKPLPPPEFQPTPVPWVIAGVGGVALTSAAIFGGFSLAAESTANDSKTSAREAENKAQDARDFSVVANVLFVAGGLLTLTGGIWGAVDLTSRPADPVGVGPGTIIFRGVF